MTAAALLSVLAWTGFTFMELLVIADYVTFLLFIVGCALYCLDPRIKRMLAQIGRKDDYGKETSRQ